MEPDKPQSAELRKYTGPVGGVKVLVVDTNSACRPDQNCFFHLDLRILSVLVVSATLDSEALSIIGEKKNKINLVRVEAQLPDIEIYELIEKMESSNIPSFIMTACNDDISSISQALRTGAK